VLWARSGNLDTGRSAELPVTAMTLHNAGSVTGDWTSSDIDNHQTNEWNGFRELSPDELDALAESIVEQVRRRGPFLTMSEFVNRQIGPESDLTRMGALEQAIEVSGV